MQSEAPTRPSDAFQLKGSLFTLTLMQLYSVNLESLATQLAATIKRSPNFFQNAPIVLDLHALVMTDAILDFESLIKLLREHSLIPVGIRGGTPQQKEGALAAGLATFPSAKVDKSDDPPKVEKSAAIPEPAPCKAGSPTKVVTSPVRSGQQIYAQGGDLLVLAPVSHGAELLADGHITVYGTLRGRALAGVTGDVNAHIFCTKLEAELLSIAGHYQVSEHIKKLECNGLSHIYLADGRLTISEME